MLSRECLDLGDLSSRSQRAQRGRRAPAALVGLACAASVLVLSGSAHALPLLTLSGSVRGLYGSDLDDSVVTPYGPGLGLSAGVTLPASLYLGASLGYFFGESVSVLGVDTSSSLFQVLGHVGYDAGFGPLTLRPSLGFGFAQASIDVEGIGDASESDFVLSPGAELFIGLGLLSVSGEIRYNKIFSDSGVDALILGVGLGFSL
jgi:hypothetical protein